MPEAARLGDPVRGMTDGEHSGHPDPHPPEEFTGNIAEGSGDVFIDGEPAARVGDMTQEYDSCCGMSTGSIGSGSGSVFINSRPAARRGDALNAHNGTGTIHRGSGDVIIGD